MAVLKCGDVVLPSPVSLSTTDEIIWSKNTGRNNLARMIGTVIAEKKTLNVTWGILTETEYMIIKNNLIAGFFPITFHDDGEDITINSYRGTINKDAIGRLNDGIYYYRSATVSIIQQ